MVLVSLNHRFRDLRTEVASPMRCFADCTYQILSRIRLHHIAFCPAPETRQDVSAIGVHGQKNRLGLGGDALDFARRFDAIQSGMAISRSATSGSSVAASCRVSCPFAASPTTLNPSRSTRAFKPSRTIW